MIKKTLNGNKRETYNKALELINLLFPEKHQLKKLERLCLVEFLLLDVEEEYTRFNSKNKLLVIEKMKDMHNYKLVKSSLSVTLSSLHEKKYIIKEPDNIILLSSFLQNKILNNSEILLQINLQNNDNIQHEQHT